MNPVINNFFFSFRPIGIISFSLSSLLLLSSFLLLRFFSHSGLLAPLSFFFLKFQRSSIDSVLSIINCGLILIDGLCKKSEIDKTKALVHDKISQGQKPNVRTYSAIISALCNQRQDKVDELLPVTSLYGTCKKVKIEKANEFSRLHGFYQA
jgi:PPR repeat family